MVTLLLVFKLIPTLCDLVSKRWINGWTDLGEHDFGSVRKFSEILKFLSILLRGKVWRINNRLHQKLKSLEFKLQAFEKKE